MTGDEIIEGLETIQFNSYSTTVHWTIDGAIDLINRQKAEIEMLQADFTRVCAERDARICTNNFIRAEAIKEFAEMLKGELTEILIWYEVGNFEYPAYDPNKTHNVINNLVKKAVGDYNDG